MWNELMVPVSIIGGMGGLLGIGLAYASKKFEVKVDERISMVREVLPGANCGGCGYSGCDGFAEAVVEGRCKADGCPVGGRETAKKIAELMGIDAGDGIQKVARVMCGGDCSSSKQKFDYVGIHDCTAAANLFGGPYACSYGCVGMGDCVRACPFNAIRVEDGVAKVDQTKCTSCAKCVAECPKKLIRLVPLDNMYAVKCSSLDKGAVVRNNCSVGCIGCGKCTKVCPKQAVSVTGTLAKIDPVLCENCGECMKVCPTRAIDVFLSHCCK